MNLLFVVPTLYTGGAERVVSRLASAFCEEHRVYILITFPAGNHSGMYEYDPRITIKEMNVPDFRRRFLRRIPYLRSIRWFREIRRLKKEWDIDVSISFLTNCNYDNVLSRAREKVIVSIRSTLAGTIPDDPKAAKKKIRRIRTAAKKADLIVCVSKNSATEHIRDYGAEASKVRTIYNPVEPEILRESAKAGTGCPEFDALVDSGRRIILSAGRLTAQKGQIHLIRAFAEVRRRHPECALVILGKGELEEELKQAALGCGLGDDVLFPGFYPSPFSFMARSEVFVLSSYFEGFSNALLEAMAVGLPAVACDCNSGPRELFAPSTDPEMTASDVELTEFGILTPPPYIDAAKAEGALADAICRLLEDEPLMKHYREMSLTRADDFRTAFILDQWRSLL